MEENKICPECGYPMDKKLVKKGGAWKVRIEDLTCILCGHKERKSSKSEYARACKIKDQTYIEL